MNERVKKVIDKWIENNEIIVVSKDELYIFTCIGENIINKFEFSNFNDWKQVKDYIENILISDENYFIK